MAVQNRLQGVVRIWRRTSVRVHSAGGLSKWVARVENVRGR